jgi:hypothetical protein
MVSFFSVEDLVEQSTRLQMGSSSQETLNSHEPREVRRAPVAHGARHSANRQRLLRESVILFSQSADQVIFPILLLDQVIVILNSRIYHLRFAFVPFLFLYRRRHKRFFEHIKIYPSNIKVLWKGKSLIMKLKSFAKK